MASTLKTITVSELIELLQDENPDARVIFAADYGDHGRTQQAIALRGDVDEVLLTKSAYSDSGFAVDTDPDEVGEDEAVMTYLLLK